MVNFDEFIIEQAEKHNLPCPLKRSRLFSAVIAGQLILSKEVEKMFLALNESAQTFIIAGAGLQGLLLVRHNNTMAALYEIELSAEFR